jgi:hypothetical protein
MDSKDLTDLYEAYLNVYENVEEVESIIEAKEDENLSREEKVNKRNERFGMTSRQRRAEHRSERGERGNYGVDGDRYEAGQPSVRIRGRGYKDNRPKTPQLSSKTIRVSEEYDNFDLVLEYLLDEGLCDTQENAEAMMAHMSEEWVESIIEAKEDENLSGVEKIGKRNRRSGFTTRERRDDHRNMRGERGNYGHDSERYQSGRSKYPSVRIRGRGYKDL